MRSKVAKVIKKYCALIGEIDSRPLRLKSRPDYVLRQEYKTLNKQERTKFIKQKKKIIAIELEKLKKSKDAE